MHTKCMWTPKLFLDAGVGIPNQVINTLQWAWMKQERVWSAVRSIAVDSAQPFWLQIDPLTFNLPPTCN